MPDNAPVILAVDGPPGAGKTSLLARIAPAYGDACTFFTECSAALKIPMRRAFSGIGDADVAGGLRGGGG